MKNYRDQFVIIDYVSMPFSPHKRQLFCPKTPAAPKPSSSLFASTVGAIKQQAAMDALQIYRNSSVEWNPSPVVALATSLDASQVAAARADGSVEIWLVSPGSVGWHCQLTIQGNPDSRVSSLVWFPVASKSTEAPTGRLFSSSIDGSVSEWDLFSLKQKVVLESIGVSIWQMAVEPCDDSKVVANGFSKHKDDDDKDEEEEDEEEENAVELNSVEHHGESCHVALGCDDGSVRLYAVSDSDRLTYSRSSLRVSGKI